MESRATVGYQYVVKQIELEHPLLDVVQHILSSLSSADQAEYNRA